MWLLFQLDGILFGFLLLSSSSVFQSAAVPGGRNSISPPSPSPVRWRQVYMTYHPDKYNKTRHFLSEFYHKYYKGLIADEMVGGPLMLDFNKVIVADKKGLDPNLKISLSGSDVVSSDPWEVVREQSIFILFSKFKNRGRNIFHISDALFQLLKKTDADNITFDNIKFPYKTFYIYFGKQTHWEIEKGKYIDGAYVNVDTEDKYLQFILTTQDDFVDTNLSKRYIYLFDETKSIGLDFEEKPGISINEAIQNEFVKLEESIVDKDKKYEEVLQKIELDEEHKEGIRAAREYYKQEFETDDLNRYSKDKTYLQHFKGICSLIINSVLYLNLENREVTTSYPPTTPRMFIDELKNAKQKNKRKIIEDKIERLGYTKIHYCGKNLHYL
jgi:hypothetical protein